MKDKPSRHLSLVEPFEFKLYTQSNDPDTFGDEDVTIPSVIAELTYNYNQYHVDRSGNKSVNWLYLSNYPEKAGRIIENLRHRVKFSKAPGLQVTISCCITLGLSRLHASMSIKQLSSLCVAYKKKRKTGSLVEGFVGKYFNMDITCEVGGRDARIAVSEDVKNQIALMSSETGLTQSSIGIMAIYATLIQQKETPPNFVNEWQEALDNALALVECKYKGAKTIMEMLGNETEKEED